MNFQYIRLADDIENKIMTGSYTIGEKLPSIRKLHDRLGLSISTIYQAYIELEKRGSVESRSKSGYFVKAPLQGLLPLPEMKRHESIPQKVEINSLAISIVESSFDASLVPLGAAVPSPELLPIKQLYRILKSFQVRDIQKITAYESPYGCLELRHQIAKRSLEVADHIGVEDIIVTNGCIEAIALCLRAVAKPGDTIAVESPNFYLFLQLIEDLNMYALEIPSDPTYGVDPDYLEKAVKSNKINAALFISNFQNPLGATIPEENKKKIVALLNRENIPLIEDDIYGDLYFGKVRPGSLKFYDKKGLVLYCSSFSKVLAPGLRVGWTVPGRFKEAVLRMKLNSSLGSPRLTQLVIAEFLKNDSFDRHLRSLRHALKNQVHNTAMAIARSFPDGTKVSAPEGGFVLWVQLHESLDGYEIFREARKRNISIVPGIICSSNGKYRNYIRISCGYPCSEEIMQGIATLGKLVKS